MLSAIETILTGCVSPYNSIKKPIQLGQHRVARGVGGRIPAGQRHKQLVSFIIDRRLNDLPLNLLNEHLEGRVGKQAIVSRSE